MSALTPLLLAQTLQLVMSHAGIGTHKHAQNQQDYCQQYQQQPVRCYQQQCLLKDVRMKLSHLACRR